MLPTANSRDFPFPALLRIKSHQEEFVVNPNDLRFVRLFPFDQYSELTILDSAGYVLTVTFNNQQRNQEKIKHLFRFTVSNRWANIHDNERTHHFAFNLSAIQNLAANNIPNQVNIIVAMQFNLSFSVHLHPTNYDWLVKKLAEWFIKPASERENPVPIIPVEIIEFESTSWNIRAYNTLPLDLFAPLTPWTPYLPQEVASQAPKNYISAAQDLRVLTPKPFALDMVNRASSSATSLAPSIPRTYPPPTSSAMAKPVAPSAKPAAVPAAPKMAPVPKLVNPEKVGEKRRAADQSGLPH